MPSPPSAKYVLIQTTMGDYRQAFVKAIIEHFNESLTILCGQTYFYESLKTGVVGSRVFVTARNIFFLKRRVLLQLGVQRTAIQADAAVLEYNPRIINTWTVAFIRRILGRRTILWGHVYSRRGNDNWLRYFQRSLATGLIVYTEQQKEILINELKYRGEAFAAPNALYTHAEMQPLDGPERTGFLYVGRLVADKKPMQMLNAFVMALPQLPADSKLLIVGDGPDRANLERRILELNLSDRVKMFGHVGDYARLKEIYRQSLASISAGAVGLSITQSLGFGVPMLYSRHDPHGPEIVAAREGWNCLCFETDSVDDLAAHMLQLQNERAAWISRAPAISSECRASFSVEKMAGEFIKALVGPDK